MVSKYQRSYVWSASKGICHYCKRKMELYGGGQLRFTVDHKKPKARKGNDQTRNLIASCRRCNELKGSVGYNDFREFISVYGFINVARKMRSLTHEEYMANQRMWNSIHGIMPSVSTDIVLKPEPNPTIPPLIYPSDNLFVRASREYLRSTRMLIGAMNGQAQTNFSAA